MNLSTIFEIFEYTHRDYEWHYEYFIWIWYELWYEQILEDVDPRQLQCRVYSNMTTFVTYPHINEYYDRIFQYFFIL